MNDQELDHTALVQHHNDTGNERTVRKPQCHVPPLVRKKTDAHVETLLQHITCHTAISLSQWAAHVVLVTKKGGIDRSCVDYLDLKKVTRRDFPFLTQVQDILDFLHGTYYYFILDLP